MAKNFQRTAMVMGTAFLAIHQPAAWAQSTGWTITYGPQATSVPTLSEWAILTLVLLMAAFAVYTLRKRGAGAGPLASVLVVSAMALGGVTGHRIVDEAYAKIQSAEVVMGATGILTFIDIAPEIKVTNGTTVAQTIISVTLGGSPWSGITSARPSCQVGLVLGPNASCYVTSGTT